MIWLGILIPFLGTVIGSFLVFFLRNELPILIEKCLLGFAGGVMMAASIFSLLIPAMDQVGDHGWLVSTVGFLLGILFLWILDAIIPHVHVLSDQEEGMTVSIQRSTKLFLAMTLHNVPEGMALGIVLVNFLQMPNQLALGASLALTIGIAIQNIPEGAVVSLPLKQQGYSKMKAFLFGSFSGIVEPLGAMLTILFSTWIQPILPWVLSFAAGAMIYVVVEELVPQSQTGKHSNWATISFALGFACMMILDSTLG